MYVTRLAYKSYRNLIDGSISPGEGINIICGGNAQGKTNLLEALWLFTGGHSFRGTKDSEIPRLNMETGRNADSCSLAIDFYSRDRDQKAQLNIEKGRRSTIINGVEKKSGTALIGKICAVIFSPEHLQLIKGGPGGRRNFVDAAICQIRPGYAKTLSSYQRSVLQRNTLLKDITRHPDLMDTLDVWDMRLSKYGSILMEERGKYISRISSEISKIYAGISKHKEEISFCYKPSVDLGEQPLTECLLQSRSMDIRTGYSSRGPHRDDLNIDINGISARMFASQGQQRSAVLAMKLAEAQILFEETGEAPIILLDDVLSELDISRQDYLLNNLHDRQVFITCCTPDVILGGGKQFMVEKGEVEINS